MRPGPELDALVAETVLGWVWRRSRETGRRCLYQPDPLLWPEWMDKPADGTEPVVTSPSVPMVPYVPYSTDLTTCAAAAEEARKAGKLRFWLLTSPAVDPRWSALIDVTPNWAPTQAWGDSAAHCLALALLKAGGHG